MVKIVNILFIFTSTWTHACYAPSSDMITIQVLHEKCLKLLVFVSNFEPLSFLKYTAHKCQIVSQKFEFQIHEYIKPATQNVIYHPQ